MLRKTIVALALATSCASIGVTPSLAATAASRAASENSPWYQTDYGAALSRINPSEHVLNPSAVTKVKYLRSVAAPATPPHAQCGRESIAAPALVGGYVYALTNYTLSKYNAATGKLVWRRIPDKTYFTEYESLSVANGIVVVGGPLCDSESEPASGLYAYNAATGKLIWSASPAEALGQEVASNGYVVTAGTDAAGYFFYVLNLSNGKTVWDSTTSCMPHPVNPLAIGSIAMLYGCDSQGNPSIEARTLSTGTPVWSRPGAWTFQRGSTSGNLVFAADPAGAVVALNSATGQTEYTLSKAVNVLAVSGTNVYATCGSQGTHVCAYKAKSGALEWKNTQFLPTPSLAAEADGVLYLDSGIALNAATGSVIKMLYGGYLDTRTTALAVGDGRIAAVSDPRVLDLFGLPGY